MFLPLVLAKLGINSGFQAFAAVQTRELVLWATGIILSCNGVSMLKMWMFNRMNMLAILS